ncbi:hypothetical protein G3576_26305 [Roseomonas stagni]|uniref:Uncharacterized protein n=1 Tax=Falsiroseomonas algicola TaxID=2716930 RepID=A0A6M1LU58_9PROT|nr:hypothetical protein [Falsiroseomonas algicola]NGM23553.1 hypothetical protein [Falsiroseomonas algicola]
MQSDTEVKDMVRKFSELILAEAVQHREPCDYLSGLTIQIERTLQQAAGYSVDVVADIESRAVVAAAFGSALALIRKRLGCE